MKEYQAPIIVEEEIELEDIIMKSFGDSSTNDTVINDFWDE